MVEVHQVTQGLRGETVVLQCMHCGATVQDDGQAPQTTSLATERGRRGRVIISGYGEPHKKLLATALKESFATEVAACPTGEALLVEFTRGIRDGQPPGLLILESAMPVLNGINTALCVRALEKGGHISPPTPILFFTNKELDETLRKVVRFVAPAKYLPIGDTAPDTFRQKAAQVADLLGQEKW